MKQDLREALPKVRNPPSFTLRKEKNKEGFVKPAPDGDPDQSKNLMGSKLDPDPSSIFFS